MTDQTRQNAINYIRTALDVDDWAKDAAIEALEAYHVDEGPIECPVTVEEIDRCLEMINRGDE